MKVQMDVKYLYNHECESGNAGMTDGRFKGRVRSGRELGEGGSPMQHGERETKLGGSWASHCTS